MIDTICLGATFGYNSGLVSCEFSLNNGLYLKDPCALDMFSPHRQICQSSCVVLHQRFVLLLHCYLALLTMWALFNTSMSRCQTLKASPQFQ